MWTPTTDRKLGIAVAEFKCLDVPFSLPLSVGDAVQILEECSSGWMRGVRISDKAKGIFPSTCVSIKSHTLYNPGPFETAVSTEDETALEISSILREWIILLKEIFVAGDSKRFAVLLKTIQDLIVLRRELLNGKATKMRMIELRLRSTALIDWGSNERAVILEKMPTESKDADKDCPAIIFTGLEKEDPRKQLYKDMYLVARIYRHGSMQPVGTSSTSPIDTLKKPNLTTASSCFRRPFACGVFGLSNALTYISSRAEGDQLVRLYSGQDADFGNIHELLAKKQTSRLSVLQNNNSKNDLEAILVGGEFEKSPKGFQKNVEITLELVDEQGKSIQNAIRQSCCHKENVSKFDSAVLYHCSNPRWLESIRFYIPEKVSFGKLCKTHLRLLIKHCSTRDKCDRKLFGFAFLPLVNAKGVAIKNATHCLSVYKCEDLSKLRDPVRYFSLPWDRNQANSTITSGELLSVLRWRSHPDYLVDSLRNLSKVDAVDIFKFLPNLLDTLFSLLATESGKCTPNSELVFKILVHVFFLSRQNDGEAKGNSYRRILFTYAENGFFAAHTDKILFSFMSQMISKSSETCQNIEDSIVVKKTLSTLDLLLLFVVRCREIKAQLDNCEDMLEEFDASLSDALKPIRTLFGQSCSGTEVTSLQICFLECGAKCCDRLLRMWPVQKTAEFLAPLLCSLQGYCLESTSMDSAVLKFVLDVVKGESFRNYESLRFVLGPIVALLASTLNHGQGSCLELTTKLLEELVQIFYEKNKFSASKKRLSFESDVSLLCSTLIEPLVTCLLSVDRINPVLGHLISCLFGMLGLMSSGDYHSVVEILKSKGGAKKLKDFLFRLFLIFHDILKWSFNGDSASSLIPTRWRIFRLLISNIMLSALQEVSEILSEEFLQTSSFDYQLWSKYFNLCASFVTQPVLQLEQITPAKRTELLEKYGDMRVLMCFQFASLWSHLGCKQSYFCPSLIAPLLDISLIPEMQVRCASLPLFFDIFQADYTKTGQIHQASSTLIERLDSLINAGFGDTDYNALFKQMLTETIAKNEPVWHEEGVLLVDKISNLLEMLLDYRCVRENADFVGKRMTCILNLANFYRSEFECDEMHSRYVLLLHELLLSSGCFVEAAGALRVYANLLNWGRRTLNSDENFPTQTEWQRKEMLYQQIISHYDTGKCWEKCIEMYMELSVFYEKEIFDYKKVSQVYRSIAEMYEKILWGSQRLEPEYFRVAFHGQHFPGFVKNRILIFRGHPYEKISHFCHRLMGEWPEATLLPFGASRDDTFAIANAQYIEICSVKPVPTNCAELNSFDASENVKRYYRMNEVDSFQYSRPLSGYGNCCNFQNLWTERIIMRTEEKLPCALPWSSVVQESRELVAPIQNACLTVREKNEELRRLAEVYTAQLHGTSTKLRVGGQETTAQKIFESNQPLLMVLKGTIEAAVNGGIAMYGQAFFTLDFISSTPVAQHANLQELRILLSEQLQLLDRCLKLSSQLISEECKPLQKHLVQCFEDLKKDMKKNLDSPQLRRVSGGSYAKFSLPSTPESMAVTSFPLPRRVSKRRRRNTEMQWTSSCSSGQKEAVMSSSWDATMACHSGTDQEEDSDESFYYTHTDANDNEGLLIPVYREKCDTSSSRPLSVHWDSSVEDVSQPKSGPGNLSDSNLSRHTRDGSPGRLRRMMQRFSSTAVGTVISAASPNSKSPSRSPRASVDSGIEKESSRGSGNVRAKSPRWTRKFSSPFSSFNFQSNGKPLSYQLLTSQFDSEDYDVENVERVSAESSDLRSHANRSLPSYKTGVTAAEKKPKDTMLQKSE